jgi:ParB/RepB/Spo0J family partition protein
MEKDQTILWNSGNGRSRLIDLKELDVGENIRDVGDIAELAASIVAVYEVSGGHKYLLQPVVVRRTKKGDKKFSLRYGYRRVAALRYLAEKHPDKCIWANKVPALVDEDDYDEVDGAGVAYQLIENIQRENMDILDEAHAIERFIEVSGQSQSAAAKTFGKSKGWVSQRLALLKTDATVQSAVQDKKIGQATARELGKASKENQRAIVAEIVSSDKEIPTEDVRDLVDLLSARIADPETSHEDRVSLIKERAPYLNGAGQDPVVTEKKTAPTPVSSTGGADKYRQAMEDALAKHDKLRAAFYAGAEQGLLYASGERKVIRFPKNLEED